MSTTVQIDCDVTRPGTPLPHIWEHCIGSGHATLALRADYQEQLTRCRTELGVRRVRFHGLLSDDMSTAMREEDNLVYSFANTDRIWDFLQSIGMHPLVELSFMPTALASGKKTVFHYKANVTPPRDYTAWATLIKTLAQHCIDRYGPDEVRQWLFEVWNEPNIHAFWTGRRKDYFTLYQQTATTLKAVDPELQVGGPVTANDRWIAPFIDFCTTNNVPTDFISTHHYPTDAFGTSNEDVTGQLANSSRSFLRDRARTTHKRAAGRPLYYTEWNTSSSDRDPLHDEPYAAAVIVKTMLEATGLADGYSFWTFSDIFEEHFFPALPFHGGFGLLNLYGIAKPSYRAFELLHALGTDLVASWTDNHPTVDAWVVRNAAGLTVMLTNHALPRHPIETVHIALQLRGTSQPHGLSLARIDADHANAKARWIDMHQPSYPTESQLADLHDASKLSYTSHQWTFADGVFRTDLRLPPHAVAALSIDLSPPAHPPSTHV